MVKYIYVYFILQVLGLTAFGQIGPQRDSTSAFFKVKSIVGKDSSIAQSSDFNHVSSLAVQVKFSIRNVLLRRKRKLDSLPSSKQQPTISGIREKLVIDSLEQSYAIRLDSIKSSTVGPLAVKKKCTSLKHVYDKALSKKIAFPKRNGMKLSKGVGELSNRTLLTTAKIPPSCVAKIQGVGDLSENSPNYDISLSEADLPSLNVQDASLPGIQNPDVNLVQLGELKKQEPDGFGNVSDVVGDVSAQTEEVGGLARDAKRLKEEGINSDEANELTDGAIRNAKPLNSVADQLKEAEKLVQLKELGVVKAKNAQTARNQLASKLTTDKLLQNEETVKAYMEKMGKRKRKFDQISDMRYIPRIKPNEMKGKRLKERLVPGMLFQILESGQTRTTEKIVSWFLAPELLYRISGKISAGGGGVYRLQYSMAPKMDWNKPLYGYKLIGQAKLWKNFYVRTEWENLSFHYPAATIDGQKHVWKDVFLAGGGYVQSISGGLSGYFWAFYNVTRDPQDIIRNRVILKTGLQFKLVNNHKKLIKHVSEKMKVQREYFKQQVKN